MPPPPPPPPLITHPSGTGLNQTGVTGALQPTLAETPTDPSLIHDLILEGARDQGLCQSPDLVPDQGAEGQHQNHQKSLLI